MERRHIELRKKKKRSLMLMTLPGIFLICIFVIIPLINGVRISFYTWNGYGKVMKFVGLDNFKALFTDMRLPRITVNTLIYGFGSCLLENVLGLAAALFVAEKFRGRNGIRAILYMPIMISGFIMGKIMSYVFTLDNGVLNDLLAVFGTGPVYWMKNSWISSLIITVVNSWQYMGLCMLIYLAGLQNISSSYLDAAAIDGASGWQQFFKIKLPLLIPAITTCVITNLINSLKLYELVVGLTNGGPNRETMSLSQYIQVLYFDDEKAGYAAAAGIFLFLLIMVLSLPINRFLRSREVQL
ncbi:MAG: sugar ABC transporter permease [Lachnospiraceae bacterium]|nr:sugar ABC transporter permease [Lachnospiraceae bacterium]